MKKLLLLSIAFVGLWVFTNCKVNAQGVGINSSGSSPDASAIFDASSTNKGMLIPRLSTSQRNAIPNPAAGLLIYNTDCNNFNYYNSSAWVDMAGNAVAGPPAAPTAAINTPSLTQIVWNWNTASGATGYKWGTTNVYSSATDNGTSTTYTQTGLTCNTPYTLYVWAYNACGNSTATSLNQNTADCFSCPFSITINHTTGNGVAPVAKTVTYGVVLSNLSGSDKCWITQNLGASNQATSITDATEASAGWYWQFNRKQGYKHDGTIRTPNTAWISSINETNDWLIANDPCTIELGAGWRIPTSTEWTNVDAAFNNTTVAYNSVLKLHAAGRLLTGGTLNNRGSDDYIWSNTQESSSDGWHFENHFVWHTEKQYAFSLRCLKDL